MERESAFSLMAAIVGLTLLGCNAIYDPSGVLDGIKCEDSYCQQSESAENDLIAPQDNSHSDSQLTPTPQP